MMTIIAVYGRMENIRRIDEIKDDLPVGITIYNLNSDKIDAKDWLGLNVVGVALGKDLLFALAPSEFLGAYSDIGVSDFISLIDVLVSKFASAGDKACITLCTINEWDELDRVDYISGNLSDVSDYMRIHCGWERISLVLQTSSYQKESYVPLVIELSV